MSKDSRGGEPVAWQWLDTAHFRKKIPSHSNAEEWRPLFTAPQPAEPVKVNAIFETENGEVIGTTDAKVKRVEWQDDGSLTVVIDYWPAQVKNDTTLFCDLKTDEEKCAFFLSGRGYETGVIAHAIQNDVAMAYHRCAEYKKELEALQSQDREDAVEVMEILDTGEWSLVRSIPGEWLTDEANNEHRWCVQRQLPPYCGKDGAHCWTGPTAISALRAGMKAIDHARRMITQREKNND